jgi:hypothetical protein
MIDIIWLLGGSAIFLAGLACGMRIAELNLRYREQRLAEQRRILNDQKAGNVMDRWPDTIGHRRLAAR